MNGCEVLVELFRSEFGFSVGALRAKDSSSTVGMAFLQMLHKMEAVFGCFCTRLEGVVVIII